MLISYTFDTDKPGDVLVIEKLAAVLALAPQEQAKMPVPLPAPALVNTKDLPPTVFTQDDVVEATLALANNAGIPVATAVLKTFGADRARDLPVEQYGPFITEAARLTTQAKATPKV